jgi:hypothetical protein
LGDFSFGPDLSKIIPFLLASVNSPLIEGIIVLLFGDSGILDRGQQKKIGALVFLKIV